jgi:hypothetical protein
MLNALINQLIMIKLTLITSRYATNYLFPSVFPWAKLNQKKERKHIYQINLFD